MSEPVAWSIQRSARGRWSWVNEQGQTHEPVTVARAFPIAQPEGLVSILDADGHELAWVPQLSQLPPALAERLREALNEREFLPEVQALLSVSGFEAPCEWTVLTHRGEHQFVLQGEEDLRRIGADGLLISDRHGVQYLVRHVSQLDRASRRLLDRFL